MSKKFEYDFKKGHEFFSSILEFMITPFELKEKIKDEIANYNIIDVRKYDYYIEGHIPFAQHVPIDEIEEHTNMFEKDKLNIVYCCSQHCNLAAKAAKYLTKKDFPVKVLCGGYHTWEKLGFDTVKTSD